MNRAMPLAFGVGALAALAWALLALNGGDVMPSYLAGWLFWLALPLGALPMAMALELLGITEWAVLPPLRRLLLLLPVVAVFGIPVMVEASALYHRPGHDLAMPADWMAPGFFVARMVAMLLAWSGLALLFARAPRRGPRRALAVLGLMLHFAMGTLAGVDWVMSLDAGLGSSAFGLLVIAGQVSAAACVAAFALALGSGGRPMPGEAAPLVLAALSGWVFLHFIQYLVTWSANLPAEVTWYQARIGGLGETALWFGFAAAVLAFMGLLPHRLARAPVALASVAAMLLLAHGVEMLWLVTPSFRGGFSLSLADLLAMCGLGGLAVGGLLLAGRAAAKEAHRGAA